MKLTVPVRTYSPNGSHGHWSVTAKRRKDLRFATLASLRCQFGQAPSAIPSAVVITRIGRGGKKMDDDNVAFSCKGMRDAIAEWLGIDDGDERVEWIYRSRLGPAFAVEIEMKR